ncbi:MAG: hypothetical protein GY714_17395 [Desulfobacterales bacterium]|nr:hypothetical protein [Desulfobacterales bacterium]MCP4159436.1 hypothetical protein [Deltaproteobacteria bacterium]
MTLSTSLDSVNWSTPVFYLYKEGSFYYLSGKISKHIEYATVNPDISVSIFKNDSDWSGLKGVQMSGVQDKVGNLLTAAKVLKDYINEFPFTKDLFNINELLKLSHKKISLYVFKPNKIIYTDNSIEFGFKQEIDPGISNN